MSLNSDDLACFVCVANTQSISRAALELGADQSTVSRQIARLEAALDARLFHRSGRGVVLTEAGNTLLTYARQVASTLSEARAAVRASTASGPAQMVIAAQPTIANTAFAAIAAALKQRFPATKVRFVEGLASPILAWLAAGEIDVALLYLPEQQGALKVDVLLEEDLTLVTPTSWSASGSHSANHLGATFPARRLGEMPMILPSTGHGVRVLAEQLAARVGTALNMTLECDASNTVAMRLVEDGCGATILPFAAVADRVAQGRLHSARIVDPVVTRQVALTTARNRPPVPELWEVMQAVRMSVRNIVMSGAWPGARLV
ncbi:LysR family transcriptional regulator [Cupriavidus plantarum]|uniref:LysR family transcriptional regulator n=1 Tax=Cupriavidus plantarum TaxID=942865 RepID=UPI000E22971D|nr:LysR family transcriptional regulator [Cupriavidus plantarum]NYH98832.1 DNA-binding transcriptional LysR family regulator [Cupriavidus plantarum]REF01757.1 LysR family transcriptional regulator [Cupriavidus plantarum]